MQWHIRASYVPGGLVDYALVNADGTPSGVPLLGASPVDLMVAAVAGCFAKSCVMVMETRRETAVPVVVNVLAEKAKDTPGRVAAMEIRYSLEGLAPDHAARIAKDAKRICTVTNSMSCDFRLVD